MMKIVKGFVDVMFWLWLFILPTSLLGIMGFLLYDASSENLPYFILLLIFGVILGVVFAEYIRNRYGLDYFFSRIIATLELDDKDDAIESSIEGDSNHKL